MEKQTPPAPTVEIGKPKVRIVTITEEQTRKETEYGIEGVASSGHNLVGWVNPNSDNTFIHDIKSIDHFQVEKTQFRVTVITTFLIRATVYPHTPTSDEEYELSADMAQIAQAHGRTCLHLFLKNNITDPNEAHKYISPMNTTKELLGKIKSGQLRVWDWVNK